jgi:carboxylesterase
LKPSLEKELELAVAAGVNHPENLPFLLLPEKPNGRGVLLVHGFTATPREMRSLGEFLCRHNFTVFGVRLPGHGTSPEDLAGRRSEEWLATVEQGFQLLAARTHTISGVGLSTGAMLLLKLSLLRSFEKLVLLSPYLRMKHALAPLVGWLSLLIPYQDREIGTHDQPFYYPRRPLKGVIQINRLLRQLQGKLELIKTPVLVLASEGDATISPGTSRRLFNRLGSRRKQFHCYGPEVPHVLTTAENPLQQDVFFRTLSFLNSRLTDDT